MRALSRSLVILSVLSLSLILPGCGSAGGALALQIARKALEAASTMSSEQPEGPCRCVAGDAGAPAPPAPSPSPLADGGSPDGL